MLRHAVHTPLPLYERGAGTAGHQWNTTDSSATPLKKFGRRAMTFSYSDILHKNLKFHITKYFNSPPSKQNT